MKGLFVRIHKYWMKFLISIKAKRSVKQLLSGDILGDSCVFRFGPDQYERVAEIAMNMVKIISDCYVMPKVGSLDEYHHNAVGWLITPKGFLQSVTNSKLIGMCLDRFEQNFQIFCMQVQSA